jgi:nucleotide-binding universal stress UspA family protein
MRRIRRIVVGTDFSDGAHQALDSALALAAVHGARTATRPVLVIQGEGLAE